MGGAFKCYDVFLKHFWLEPQSQLVSATQLDWSSPQYHVQAYEYAQWAWLLCRFHRVSGAAQKGVISALYNKASSFWVSSHADGDVRNQLVKEAQNAEGALDEEPADHKRGRVLLSACLAKAALYMAAQKVSPLEHSAQSAPSQAQNKKSGAVSAASAATGFVYTDLLDQEVGRYLSHIMGCAVDALPGLFFDEASGERWCSVDELHEVFQVALTGQHYLMGRLK